MADQFSGPEGGSMEGIAVSKSGGSSSFKHGTAIRQKSIFGCDRPPQRIMYRDADLCPVHRCDECIYSPLSTISDGNLCNGYIRKNSIRGAFDCISDFTGRAAPLKGICGDQNIHGQFLLKNMIAPTAVSHLCD